MKLASLILSLLAASTAARAQTVKDFVDVDGARANKLRGYGIVTGLDGTGDSPRGESARLLGAMIQSLLPPDVAAAEVDSRNAALVMVSAELPPFQKKGTRLDVSVSALGDSRSLAGGELQLTDLRGPRGRQDPLIYALASGRLVVQGDGRRGASTAGCVPGGAILERELAHAFVQDRPDGGRGVRLLLKRPDFGSASRIAREINARLPGGPATAPDGGVVEVRLPPTPGDARPDPVRWLDLVLNLPVELPPTDAASVVIDDAAKSVSWSGEVRLAGGSVALPAPASGVRPTVFHCRDGQRFSEFMEKTGPALAEHQLVDLVKALHGAGLLRAELRSR